MKFKSVGDKIVHITMPCDKSLAKAMHRLQESYESPFPEIKGKVFTLGYLKSLGHRQAVGINTYCGGNHFNADWGGYNFPNYVLEPFIKGLFDPLTTEEQDIVEALRYREDTFYVIGTSGEDSESTSLEHEIRHALYYISGKYRIEVNKLLNKHKNSLQPLSKCLMDWGYDESVILDECQAYIGPNYDWLFDENAEDIKKYKIKINKSLSDKLNIIAKKYKKELGIDI